MRRTDALVSSRSILASTSARRSERAESPLAAARADATAGDGAYAVAWADALALADALADALGPSGNPLLVEVVVPVEVFALVETVVPLPFVTMDVFVFAALLVAVLDEPPDVAFAVTVCEEVDPGPRWFALTATRIPSGPTRTPTSVAVSDTATRVRPSRDFTAILGFRTVVSDDACATA